MSGSAFDWIGSIFGGGGGGALPTSGAGEVPASGAPLASPEDMQAAGWDDTGGGTWTDPNSFASTGAPGTGAVDSGQFSLPGGGGADFSDKLKKAIGGLQGIAQKSAPATAASGWAFGGQPRPGTASAVRGQAPPGLSDMITQMQQRAQLLRGQYLAPGNLPPRAPGGGLLGM